MKLAARAAHLLSVAVQLLTRIPVGVGAFDDADLRAARPFFPIVGFLVAGAGALTRAATGGVVGQRPATVLAVGVMVLITGAFHEDGLADSADGLWGGRAPAHRLQIMKDSRIGTYGTTALILAFALRLTVLAPLDLGHFTRAVVAGHVLGRIAGAALSAISAPAAAGGLGAHVIGPAGPSTWLALVGVGASTLLVASGIWGLATIAPFTIALVMLVRRIGQRRLGGITGDLLGAVNQLVELTAMLVIAALVRARWT